MPQLNLAYRDACDIVTLFTCLSSTLRTTQRIADLFDSVTLPEKLDPAIARLDTTCDGLSNVLAAAGIDPPSAWRVGEFAPAGTPYDFRQLELSAGQYDELLFLVAWAQRAGDIDLQGAPPLVKDPLAYYARQARRLLHNLAYADAPAPYCPAPELTEFAPPTTTLPPLQLAATYTLALRTHQAVAIARELGASVAIFAQVVRDGKRRLLAQPNLAPLVRQLESLHARLLTASLPLAGALAAAGVPAPKQAATADPFQEYQVTFAGRDLQQLILSLDYLRKTYQDLPTAGEIAQLARLMQEASAPLKPATEQFYHAAERAGFPLAALVEYVG